MAINRRQLMIATSRLGLVWTGLTWANGAWATSKRPAAAQTKTYDLLAAINVADRKSQYGQADLIGYMPGASDQLTVPLAMPYVHSIQANHDQTIVLLISKKDHRLQIVQRAGSKLRKRLVTALDRHEFSGHGGLLPDGKSFYVGEVDKKSDAGVITIRSVESGAVLKQLPGHGFDSHELRYEPQAKVFVQAGRIGEEQAFINVIDAATGTLKKRIACPVPGHYLRHFSRILDHETIFVAGKLGKPMMMRNASDWALLLRMNLKTGKVERVEIPAAVQKLYGQSYQFLSVDYLPNQKIVGATSPNNGLLLAIDPQTLKLRHHLKLANQPNGIAASPVSDQLIYVNTEEGDLYILDPLDGEIALHAEGGSANTAHLWTPA